MTGPICFCWGVWWEAHQLNQRQVRISYLLIAWLSKTRSKMGSRFDCWEAPRLSSVFQSSIRDKWRRNSSKAKLLNKFWLIIREPSSDPRPSFCSRLILIIWWPFQRALWTGLTLWRLEQRVSWSSGRTISYRLEGTASRSETTWPSTKPTTLTSTWSNPSWSRGTRCLPVLRGTAW